MGEKYSQTIPVVHLYCWWRRSIAMCVPPKIGMLNYSNSFISLCISSKVVYTEHENRWLTTGQSLSCRFRFYLTLFSPLKNSCEDGTRERLLGWVCNCACVHGVTVHSVSVYNVSAIQSLIVGLHKPAHPLLWEEQIRHLLFLSSILFGCIIL